MARLIRTNHEDKWEVYSTVSGSILATFVTEHELKVWLAKEEIYAGKLRAIEHLMTYPNRWTINGEEQFRKSGKYYSWVESLDYTNKEKYYEQIDEMLTKLIVEDK